MIAIITGGYQLLNLSEAYAFVDHQGYSFTQMKKITDITYKQMKDIKDVAILIDDIFAIGGKNKNRRLVKLMREGIERNLLFTITVENINLVDKRIRANTDIQVMVGKESSRYLLSNNKYTERNTKFYLVDFSNEK